MASSYKRDLVLQVSYAGDSWPPACECGCGEPVRYSRYGPQKFVNRAHSYWHRKYVSYGFMVQQEKLKYIEGDRFAAALRRIMADKGYSQRELARRGGWQYGEVTNFLYGRKTRITETRAKSFLRRVAGLAEPLTPHQIKLAERKSRRLRVLERETFK